MNELEIEYKQACETDSDINQHLPTLRRYARKVKSVTELGVRRGVSTRAFLVCPVDYVGYDLNMVPPGLRELGSTATMDRPDRKVEFRRGDSTKISIDETDLLFIDTLHNYLQLAQELRIHNKHVSRYIILHDTHTFGYRDESGGGPGLVPALLEFMDKQVGNWAIIEHRVHNNGLTIMERISGNIVSS